MGIARVTGATIVNRVEELQESDVGEDCGLLEVKKVGDEYFTYMTECKNPKACSVLLRGASKDVLNEIERNLHDAWNVARNIILEPKLLPGGGAAEMHLSCKMKQKAKSETGSKQYAYAASMQGVDGVTGKIVDAKEAGILDTFTTKAQVIKASAEAAAMILRIDDIVSGQKSSRKGGGGGGPMMAEGNPNSALEG